MADWNHDILTLLHLVARPPHYAHFPGRANPAAPLTAALVHEVRAATPPALRHWPTVTLLQLGGAIAIAALWLP